MSDPAPGSVVVSGFGAASVVPDLAQIEVSVDVTAADPAAAYAQSTEVTGRVVDVLDAQGIAEPDRRTRAVNLAPHYEIGAPTPDGYTATHTLLVRIVRLVAVPEVLNALVAAGGEALRLGSFTLASADTADARARADAAAIADARERAQRLAEASGKALGAVLAIRHGQPQGGSYAVGLGFRASSGAQAATLPVQAGSEAVTAQVTVTFALTEAGPNQPQ